MSDGPDEIYDTVPDELKNEMAGGGEEGIFDDIYDIPPGQREWGRKGKGGRRGREGERERERERERVCVYGVRIVLCDALIDVECVYSIM